MPCRCRARSRSRFEKGLNGCDRLLYLSVSFQGECFDKPWIWICLSCQQVSRRHYSRKICPAPAHCPPSCLVNEELQPTDTAFEL
jgi:hypothetical protein